MLGVLHCSEVQWVTTVLAMVGKLGISASFSAIYIMTVELVPTTMRNFGMGCSSSMARVSSAAAPYIADLVSNALSRDPTLLTS